MLIASRQSFWKGGISNPYISNDLIIMFDGEWNDGIGKHNTSLRGWRELVSGLLAEPDASHVSPYFYDKCAHFDNNNKLVLQNDVLKNFSNGNVSIEMISKNFGNISVASNHMCVGLGPWLDGADWRAALSMRYYHNNATHAVYSGAWNSDSTSTTGYVNANFLD